MCESETGSTCEMNVCVRDTTDKENHFLVITICVFVVIFISCMYVCFKCFEKGGRNERRPTTAELNDGAVDMVPINMMPQAFGI